MVTVDGILDYEKVKLVDAAIFKLMERERFRMILEAPELSSISESGLGVLMAYIEEVRDRGGDIKCVSPDGPYTTVEEAVEAYATEEDGRD